MNWRFVFARAWNVLLWVGPLGWLALVVAQWNYFPPYPQLVTDAHAYHIAAESIRAGASPYVQLPPPGPHTWRGFAWYLYPPPFAALLSLFPLSPIGTYNLMLAAGAAGTFGFAWAIAKLAGWSWRAVLLGLFLYPATLVAMGNVQPVIDALVALALIAAPGLAVFLLASATAIKVTPVWALGVVLVRRGGAWGLGAAVALWAGACIVTLGWDGTIAACTTWVSSVAPVLAQGQFDPGESWMTWNLSPAFAPLRTLAPWPAGAELPAWARTWLTAVQFGVPALTLYGTRRRPWLEQAGWVHVAATLSAPILRAGHVPILLLIPALVRRRRAGEREPAHPGT